MPDGSSETNWVIKAKAPAKTILLGEYTVLYGNTGIVTAVDLWTTVKITPQKGWLIVDLLDLNSTTMLPIKDIEKHMTEEGADAIPLFFTVQPKSERSLEAIWRTLVHLLGQDDLKKWEIKIEVSSTVPQGKGLGSSGSFATSFSAALLQYIDPESTPDLDRIKKEALKIESIFHGMTSGIDVEVSVYGGTRAFKEGKSRPVPNPSDCFNVVLVDTNIPRDSKKMITIAKENLAKMEEEDREASLKELEGYISKIEEIGSCGCGEAIAPFQDFLVRLGVSHLAIDGFVSLSKEHGILAKLTGAGGGGYMLAMLPKGPMYYVKLLQLKHALKNDPKTKDFEYTLSDLTTTKKGVRVSYKLNK